MRLFFIVFFTLYSLVNFYFYKKLQNLFVFNIRGKLLLLSFLLLMTFSPAIIRYFEHRGYENLAISLSWIGYLWMAFIVIFLFISLPLELIKGSHYKKPKILLTLLISILLVVYGFFEARNLKVEKVNIKSHKVSKDIKIVQISDLHVGLIIREDRVKRIADIINEINPDIVVSTGDLVDGQIDKLDKMALIFNKLNPTYGKFAVTGNHEFYAGINKSLSFIERSGFKILINEGVILKELNLTIVGVNDPESKRFEHSSKISEADILRSFRGKNFVLFLKHRPILEPDSIGLFDLQLSGHTHKGQFFPFSILTGFYYKKQAGCIENLDNCYLYISRGTGTWGPPIRIFARPEITVIEIKKI